MHSEEFIRLTAFAVVFAAVGLWEAAMPRRSLVSSRRNRWLHNLGLLAVSIIVLRILAPAAAIGVALAAEQGGWGLLTLLPLPSWMTFLAGVVLLDLAI